MDRRHLLAQKELEALIEDIEEISDSQPCSADSVTIMNQIPMKKQAMIRPICLTQTSILRLHHSANSMHREGEGQCPWLQSETASTVALSVGMPGVTTAGMVTSTFIEQTSAGRLSPETQPGKSAIVQDE
ncbi:unnamed protein product [Acanthoscelides obtectus]|uniref:Uncharacterized protein n=1 Tax=Acanthoscelides obtectus TaxID=200917 RepID=A0A9P0PR82_ACAOB|nr:unnamed protein product [Acanthoscelides obtectus]CAK1664558.1 hypothetical protein AOBTE_LOCUS24330 [Acanthoscelides obtectus]